MCRSAGLTGAGTATGWPASDQIIQYFCGTSLVLQARAQAVESLEFSTDGHWLVIAGPDKTARVLNLTARDPSSSAMVQLRTRFELAGWGDVAHLEEAQPSAAQAEG